jgi:hypothetical protein
MPSLSERFAEFVKKTFDWIEKAPPNILKTIRDLKDQLTSEQCLFNIQNAFCQIDYNVSNLLSQELDDIVRQWKTITENVSDISQALEAFEIGAASIKDVLREFLSPWVRAIIEIFIEFLKLSKLLLPKTQST